MYDLVEYDTQLSKYNDNRMSTKKVLNGREIYIVFGMTTCHHDCFYINIFLIVIVFFINYNNSHKSMPIVAVFVLACFSRPFFN